MEECLCEGNIGIILALSTNINIYMYILFSFKIKISVYDLLLDPRAPALFTQEQNPKLSLQGFSDSWQLKTSMPNSLWKRMIFPKVVDKYALPHLWEDSKTGGEGRVLAFAFSPILPRFPPQVILTPKEIHLNSDLHSGDDIIFILSF